MIKSNYEKRGKKKKKKKKKREDKIRKEIKNSRKAKLKSDFVSVSAQLEAKGQRPIELEERRLLP